MKQRIKNLLFSALGLDPDAVVVIVRSGDADRAERMARIMRELVPDRRIIDLAIEQGSTIDVALELTRRLRGLRVALMATLFDGTPAGAAQRRAVFLVAPTKVLAFNSRLERQHVKLSQWIASWLFLRGVPRDRIFLRPSWLVPWKKDRSELPRRWQLRGGRGFRGGVPKVAVVSPYLPWPRSHGGAVRLEGLLSHAAHHADILFFGFEDGQTSADYERIADFCARVYSAEKPRYREPRWSSFTPAEACEFWNRDLDRALRAEMASCGCTLLQGEYTQMARFRPDILVEHDITADLMAQVHVRRPSLNTWWDHWRWRRFEGSALDRARRVIVMSEKDRDLSGVREAVVIPNGVDLERFTPAPCHCGKRMLFVGSFRHFPNVQAWRYFREQVWPHLSGGGLAITVIAGPQPELYGPASDADARIEILGYVEDVRPHYERASLVVIPTLESAGTNLKALEAAAMGRAIVSTPSGVAGLGMKHGENVWIAEDEAAFVAGIHRLLGEPELRASLAASAREHVERNFGWPALARLQTDLWRAMSA